MAATPKLGSGGPVRQTSAKPLLEVENLVTSFTSSGGLFEKREEVAVVKGVSLTLDAGETLGLVGESGCGKSTLARSILRLVEPKSGKVRLDGQDILGLNREGLRQFRQEAQIVFQDPFASLNPRMPIHDAVTEPAFLHGRVAAGDRRDMAVDLLGRVGLEPEAADRYPHQFSGGQRQRICIARALSVGPRMIVADEAVAALDVSIARKVTDLMREIQARENIALLFISHDIATVELMSHRIAVMQAGEIVEMGATDQVIGAPKHPYTTKLIAAVPSPVPRKRDAQTPHPLPQLANA